MHRLFLLRGRPLRLLPICIGGSHRVAVFCKRDVTTMKQNFSAFKNIGWAASVFLCLLALLVGLAFAAFTPYSGPIVRGGVQLDAAPATPAPTADPMAQVGGSGELVTLGETDDAGQSYIDSLTFLCDSSMIGIRDYAILGEQGSMQIWGTSAGNLSVADLPSCTIRYPGDGSEISPVDAAMVAKPARLVIFLGSDGAMLTDEETFVRNYSDMIRAIREVSPYTLVICCSASSVANSYAGSDGLTPNVITTVNQWIRRVAAETGSYFADTASAVDDKANWLIGDYASSNGKSLNSLGINQVLSYLRTHAVQ